MNELIYITGHKNPDTDSICSAIAYAEFKNKTQNVRAIPIRLGELNNETRFVLNYFNIKEPDLIETVKTQVSDLNIDNTAPISPEISLKMAWSIMKKHNVKTLPVINQDDKLIGIASVSNLTSTYMDVWDNHILSKSNTNISNIIETLSAAPIYIHGDNPIFNGRIVIAAMHPESIKDIIEKDDIVITGDRDDTQELAINKKASLIIITGAHSINEELCEKAKQNGISIISTPHDSFTASRLITQSIPISYVMTKGNIISFRNDDFIEEIKDVMLETRYRSYPVIDKNSKVIGSVSRYHLISPNKKKIILVDHNEKTQSVHGLEDAEILEIIDHHRVADIETGLPIYFRNEPVGSTATIVASIFFDNGIRPSKTVAGLLCSAIISDTLFFKSPTATVVDKLVLKRLSQIADLDVEKFAAEMFKAGTSLKNKTVEEIFNQDFKVFTLNKQKIGVAQINTMDKEGFIALKAEMLNLMEKRCTEGNFDLLILMITDIIRGGSEFLVAGESKDLITRAFNVKLTNSNVYLPGIISRKKQVIPPITSAIISLK